MSRALTIFKPATQQPIPAAWISIAEAGARSGMPERTLRRKCGRWRSMGLAVQTGSDWRIDPAADDAFRASPAQAVAAELLDVRQVSPEKRKAACGRAEALRDLGAYIDRRMNRDAVRVGRDEAIREFAAKYGASEVTYGVRFNRSTLYRWLDAHRAAPVTGLVDKRGLAGSSRREPDPEVIVAFQQIWLADKNRGSLKNAFRKLSYLCDKTGKWFFGSYRTFCRWVESTYPKAQICLNREGEQAYRQQHEPTRDQDPEAFAAGEMYVGDHHQFRHVVWHRGRLIRPWLTAWMDQRSLLFVGFAIVPEPNQTTILAAAKHACVRFGPAKYWLMDNGRDYSGYALSGGWSRRCFLQKGYIDQVNVNGLIGMLQAEAIYCLPHSPNSKIIEGQFKIIEESFGRELPNYCGASPDDQGDDFQDRVKRARQRPPDAPGGFPSLEAFAGSWSKYLDSAYADQPSNGKYCQGLSPRAVFESKRGPTAQLADPRVLDLLDMVWSRPVVVTKHGVRFQGLRFGKWDPQIIALHGRSVLVSYNPADASRVGIWTAPEGEDRGRRFICEATINPQFSRHPEDRPLTDADRREGFRLNGQLRKALRVTQDLGHLQFADSADFMHEAQRHAIGRENKSRLVDSRPTPEATDGPSVRLIQTPLDGQVTQVLRAAERPADLIAEEADDFMARLRAANAHDEQ